MSDGENQVITGQQDPDEDPKGLALYRRKRPYRINTPLGPNPSGWDVMDVLTGEQLGRIVAVQKDDHHGYGIDLASQIGGDTKGLDRTYSTRWLAADRIWKKALPLRAIVWRALKIGVHALDWTTRAFAIVVAFYSMWKIFEAAAFTENSRLGQLSGAFFDALERCFEAWCRVNGG